MRKYRAEGATPLIKYVLTRPLSVKWLTVGFVTSRVIPSIRRKEMKKYKIYAYSQPSSFVTKEYHGDQNISFLNRVKGEYSFQQPFVAEIENASIIRNHGFAVAQDGFISDSLRARRNQLGKAVGKDPQIIKTIQKKAKSPPTKNHDLELACSLIDAKSYHLWLMKGLTRLEGVEQYVKQTGERPHLLLPSNTPSYITESLEMFGYSHEDWTKWDGSEISIKKLLIPTHRSKEDWNSQYANPLIRNIEHKVIAPPAARWVRNEATKSIKTTERKRIFILRTDADERRIVNRSDVNDLLKQYGFESYALSKLSFQQQVKLFTNAECIVGTHGAGFTNQIFSEDSIVFEFIGRHFKPTYYMLSNSCSHDYAAMKCKTVNIDNNDIYVDVPKLREYLDMLGIDEV